MDNEKFQNKYRIKSARATWHDYNGGIYFITICTQNREHFFGEIGNGIMKLSEIGKYTTECLQNINIHNPYAEIPLFVVMPNHIHAIVCIEGAFCRDVACNVSKKKKKMANIAKHQSLLCVTIRGFKSAITKFANENDLNFGWQTRFYDTIVRDQSLMNIIGNYIENNIAEWNKDCFNKNFDDNKYR
jgi:REP element-mobilizing transposase RayT